MVDKGLEIMCSKEGMADSLADAHLEEKKL